MKIWATILLLFIFFHSKGQNQLSLYQMNTSIPQANLVNPAFSPDAKITIGLPLISSTYLAIGSPLSYNDVFMQGSDDTLRLNTQTILNELKSNNKIELDANVGLLYFGLQTKAGYFSLTVNSRVDGSFTVPGDLVELVLSGSKNPEDITRISVDKLDARSSWFNEIGINYVKNITDKLSIGGRIKYLQGIANLTIDGLNGSIQSTIDSINISMQPWALHTTGLSNLENGPGGSFFTGNGNNGWALDFGAQYQLTENLRISASVLDLGSITWKADTSYFFNEVDYLFDGVDLLQLIDNNGNVLNQELDSLGELFKPEIVEGTVYKTPLTGKFYFGGTYSLAEIHEFGLLFAGEVFKGRLQPVVGLTYNIKIGKVLNAGLNFSYRNQSFGNIGAGLSARFGPIQIYGLADSFEGLVFKAADARIVSFRAGLNIMVGKSH